jgi:hypothetical protein
MIYKVSRRTITARAAQGQGSMGWMRHITRADWAGIAIVAAAGFGFWLFRELTIAPRLYGSLCTAAHPPLVCAPRQAVLWLQYQRLFGLAALVSGLIGWALGRRWLAVAAVAIGVAAVINYNGTQGMIGAALGLWAWLGLRTGRYEAAAAAK